MIQKNFYSFFDFLYRQTIDRSKFREIAQRYVVFFLPLFFLGVRPLKVGIAISIVGVLMRSWAAGYLKKDQEQAAGGPYLIARHPLYLGSCLLSLGLMISINHWFCYLFLGSLTLLVYRHTIIHEEANLVSRFGKSYLDFKENVGPLWPKLWSFQTLAKNPSKLFEGFSFQQFLKNKEYECILGVLAVYGILFWGANFKV